MTSYRDVSLWDMSDRLLYIDVQNCTLELLWCMLVNIHYVPKPYTFNVRYQKSTRKSQINVRKHVLKCTIPAHISTDAHACPEAYYYNVQHCHTALTYITVLVSQHPPITWHLNHRPTTVYNVRPSQPWSDSYVRAIQEDMAGTSGMIRKISSSLTTN